ncbi:MAG: 2-C-methyl-D-erythritol 4-phosphate cytidylyltransferase [Ignavibacterium album]|uniref:2-C-methyl-D-erythritol 4-phosphate cytidylyltransferase n=1 Tax=Ignavibacterium album TaxID=591197 RepID=UPI0026E95077|nr:2-C-methyl-D-erythritol 4-phosphate cytidylyltransferase [Ignavibacterium album]MCX8105992.1 2-C-methyl-D-erythritol 4-phosphate cytidylyltransferase [Ignavibacterium album]
MKVIAIIPAGGKGLRAGSADKKSIATPKQYLKINNKELIAYTLEKFQHNKSINRIIIAAEPNYFDLLIGIVKKYKLTKVNLIVEGGETRQHSVFNALLSSDADKNDLIVVHDAARPLIPANVLSAAIETAKEKGNAIVCIKAKDTLIKAKKYVEEYLNRDEVYYVQTPQIFKYRDLLSAMSRAFKENFIGTDESILVKKLGKKINIVEGSVFNFKVTTKEDIEMFEKLVV